MRKLRNFDKFYCIVFQEFYIHPLSREIHIPLIGLTVLCFWMVAVEDQNMSHLVNWRYPPSFFKSFFVSCSNHIFVFMKINLKRTSWGILLALVFILVYYMHTYIHTHWVLLGITQPLFQIFQILKCLNDPTCAIFLKRMPNMTVPCIKYEIQKYTNTKCLEYPT